MLGLRIAGLGGSPRYSPGPNQYTARQQARRARRLAFRAWLRRPRGATRTVDILLTHAPPRGVGDGPDPPHQGFPILNAITRWLRPALLLHGHVDPEPGGRRDHWLDGTIVRNVTGWQLMLIEPVIGLISASRAGLGAERRSGGARGSSPRAGTDKVDHNSAR